jgi:hypothetical protein
MKRRHGLLLLDIAGSVFGWTWIVAWLVTVYFLYAAIAAGGPRLYVLWAALLAWGARMIADVLRDSRQRLNYVDQLVRHGYSRREAEAAWQMAREGGHNALLNVQQAETLTGVDKMELEQGGSSR